MHRSALDFSAPIEEHQQDLDLDTNHARCQARSAYRRHVNDLEVARLERFLFGADGVSLQLVRAHLVELQHGACFYCAEPLRAAAEVDHFLPWSRHPDDRIDNLVVAHRNCNLYKKDFLASAEHLETWAARLVDRDREFVRSRHEDLVRALAPIA